MENINFIRLLLIGDTGVGKSSLLNRFSDNEFHDFHNATIGVDFRIKYFKKDNNEIKVELWDSTGNKKFRDIVASFYKRSDAIILMFDLTDITTILNLKQFIEEIELNAPSHSVKFLIGNKLDLNLHDYRKEINKIANGIDYDYFEISVKDNINIDAMFENIIDKIILSKKNINTIKLKLKNSNKKKCNCY